MKPGRNLLAGLANSAWTAVVGLLVVPFYLNHLGIEAYGLIGFFVTLQALLQLLDLGLAPTINREVARCSANGQISEARTLLHSLAYVYWAMAVLIALLVFATAPLIAEHWFQDKGLPIQTILTSVMLMGLIVASRWPVGLYAGALMGAQRLTVSSGISMVMVTISNFGAVGILAFVSPTIEAFFTWQACTGLIYALAMRLAAWQVLQKPEGVRFDIGCLKRVWRFSVGMSGVAILAVILLQIDKLVLSKLLSLEAFGHYTLATVLAGGLNILITPLFNAIYPYMTHLVANHQEKQLTEFYRLGTRLFLSLLFPVAVTISVFSNDLILLWTRDQTIANSASPIVSIFILGTAINGAMHFPFALQLAHGNSSLPLKIAFFLTIIFLPSTIVLANIYGAVGGAISWLMMNTIYLILGSWLTHRLLLKSLTIKWLITDIGIPMCLTLALTYTGGIILQQLELKNFIDIICGTALLISPSIIVLMLSPAIRNYLYMNHFIPSMVDHK